MSPEGYFSRNGSGVSLRVKAKPGGRKDAIVGVRGNELVVEVRAVAEKGRANEGIVRILAGALAVPRSSVVLKLGAGSSHKVFQLPADAEQALRRMEKET
jgi:uncharacterized protein